MVSPASSWKEAEENLLSCTAQILDQAIEILGSGVVDDAAYSFESKITAGATPGKHFRHVLDHLRILLDAIEQWQASLPSSSRLQASELSKPSAQVYRADSSQALRVDYDSRIATKLPHIETSASASLREFKATTERLYRIFDGSQGRLYSQPLRLCATTPFVVEMDSTVGRELWFCGLHAIHHYALARVILVNELGLNPIDKQFGVAPSTLVHREWRKESNRADVAHNALSQGRADEASPTPSSQRQSSQASSASSPGRSSDARSTQQLPSRRMQRRQHQLKSKL